MKYIDSEKLIAEIYKRRKDALLALDIDKANNLIDIVSLIESLQQEQQDKSFCEENCKGYKDTGGKCFFGFNCSAKKAQEQPEEMDEDFFFDKVLKVYDDNNKYPPRSEEELAMLEIIARHFYALGLNARKEESK